MQVFQNSSKGAFLVYGAFVLLGAFFESAFSESAFFEGAFLESAFLESAFFETYLLCDTCGNEMVLWSLIPLSLCAY